MSDTGWSGCHFKLPALRKNSETFRCNIKISDIKENYGSPPCLGAWSAADDSGQLDQGPPQVWQVDMATTVHSSIATHLPILNRPSNMCKTTRAPFTASKSHGLFKRPGMLVSKKYLESFLTVMEKTSWLSIDLLSWGFTSWHTARLLNWHIFSISFLEMFY